MKVLSISNKKDLLKLGVIEYDDKLMFSSIISFKYCISN